MEHALRCNNLQCRRQLEDQAVVTTCSHIFCRPCTDSLGLSTPDPNARECPACGTQLPHADDAVIANLKPSEEYKTSVLSGLSPSIILECATRALNFHGYQTGQEVVYQQCMVHSLQNRYSELSTKMDKIVDQANTQIEKMRGEFENLDLRYKDLEGKNEKLQDAFRERSKKYTSLDRRYKALKTNQMQPELELAADHDAGSLLQNPAQIQHDVSNHRNGPVMHSRAGSNGSGGRRSNGVGWDPYIANQRIGLQSARSVPVPITPSGHRQPLAQQQLYNNVHNSNRSNVNYQPTPHRTVLQSLDPNMFGNGNTPRFGGMSAGVKIGRLQNQGYSYGSVGMGRPSGLHQRG